MTVTGVRSVGGFLGAVVLTAAGLFVPTAHQAKNAAPRVELSRLTVRQFQNAVADLVGDYHPVVPYIAAGGLRGQYFKGRDQSAKGRVFERVDPGIQFDFGTAAPVGGTSPGQIDPHVFTIVWQGSVFAPDTGEYDFVIQSDQAVKLWINGGRAPLIDASIKSANQTEFHGALHLLGGRAYSVYMEFVKALSGVDDGKALKRPPSHAAVLLSWRQPKQPVEPIPAWRLYPEGIAPTFVLTTPFPPDDRSVGYERGNSVSKEWDAASVAAAIETADYVSAHIGELAGVGDGAKDRKERIEAYCRRFDARAFRRALIPELERVYVTRQFDATPSIETAVKRVVLLALQSPRFLYPELNASASDATVAASQLSFALWDSLPDPDLQRAADSGALATPDQIRKQAERMASNPRAWNKLHDFLFEWLKVDDVPEIVKDRKNYSDFDALTASDLRASMEIFLRNTAWSETSDYRDLMLSPTLYLNGRLAKLYGANLPADAPFQAVAEDGGNRAGVLTQPYLLSRFAYVNGSSPIHRGVLVVRSLLGQVLNPPPAAFIPLPASSHPDLTTRERVALQTEPKFCQSCHAIINPLGFTLERYDAIGRVRTSDAGKPVDTTGQYVASGGETAHFAGAIDLARYLADSEDAHRAFVQKLFQYCVKQPILAYGANTLPELERAFAQNRYSIRKLMVDIAVRAASLKRETMK